MALALYRKYRPRTLSELVGQETTVAILQNAARMDRIGHGYLFYGSRGTGKTTAARLIAKLLNCEKRHVDKKFHDAAEPCNECVSCAGIDAGTSLDLIEIDAASNRGIDEMRNLKESIRSGPSASRHKVYIIDEAHMLTRDAANALLKTLEEPPAHAVIVLATTEYEKLPATITSRVQRFLFRKLPKAQIIGKLSKIAQEEHIAVDDAALELIAAAGEGSLRDAESLLDQARSLEGMISAPAIEELTGRVGAAKIARLAELILQKDLKQSLAYAAEIHREGHNLVQFTKDLIHYLRKVLALAVDASLEKYLAPDLTADELKKIRGLVPLADTEKTPLAIKTLIRAYSEMPYAPFAIVALEVALIEVIGSKKKPIG